jgi:TolB-like protein
MCILFKATPIVACAPSETDTALRLPDKLSIAVLPFQTMAGDPDQDYLADSVVEAITAALSRIRSFFHRKKFRVHWPSR